MDPPRSAHRRGKSKERDKGPDPWSLITSETPSPSERYGHTAVLDESGGGLIIIFGGCDNKGAFCADLQIFNIEANRWMQLAAKGRHFHSAVVFRDQLYIWGGASNAYYNDLYRFDLDAQTWAQVPYTLDTVPPSPRYGHTAVVFGTSMYIFGGFDKDGFACNELFEYNFETSRWRLVKPQGGVTPRDSYFHTAVAHQVRRICPPKPLLINKGSMYVFGGYKHDLNQLWEYRFGSNQWSILSTTGEAPAPRWGHKCVLHKGLMYCFGGRDTVTNFYDVHEFHFDGGITGRFFSSLVVDDEYMYVFGGRNVYNFSFNELYKYNLSSKRKRRPDTLVEDFKRLVGSPNLSDVMFLFPDEPGAEPLHGHRLMLSIRCETFRAMLAAPMRESKDSKVNVRDCKRAIFLALLMYIYTGQLYITSDSVIDLLRAADMYRLEHLKALCERRLMRYIDAKNVISMLALADQYKSPELRHYCLSLCGKLLPELEKTEAYKTLEPALQSEIVACNRRDREVAGVK